MKPSFSLTDGYRELFFGQWMPHILFKQYEAEPLLLVDRLWEIPATPKSYLNSHKRVLTRWQVPGNSRFDAKEWIPPFYELSEPEEESFHPVCRFYKNILWCENRMILQVLRQWQEQLELTLLRYELVTLQNQLIEYLKECQRRIPDTDKNSEMAVEKLSRYLHSHAADSIILILLEINERFGHHLAENRLGVEEIFIRFLKMAVPSQKRWVSTPARVKWTLMNTGESNKAEQIHELLFEIRDEYNQQSERGRQKLLTDSIHLLEDVWFCHIVLSGPKNKPLDLSVPEQCTKMILHWKDLLLTGKLKNTETDDSGDPQLFHTLIRHLPKILTVLETELKPLSEAAELSLLVKNLFTEKISESSLSVALPSKKIPSDSNGHWLLDQYLPLHLIQEKLEVTSRTMRTYISEYNLPVSEITGKSKWVKADDFDAFMERFKKKSTGS